MVATEEVAAAATTADPETGTAPAAARSAGYFSHPIFLGNFVSEILVDRKLD